MITKFTFDGEELHIKVKSCVTSSAIAVVLEDAHGGRYATLSTNLSQEPSEGCFWLKDWSENERIAKALLAAGVITLTGRKKDLGFVVAKEARLKGRA